MNISAALHSSRFMCDEIKLVNGSTVLICGTGASQFCVVCGRLATALCDWKVSTRNTGTCDRPICQTHGKQVAAGKHLCPEHQVAYQGWKRRHPPAQGALFAEEPSTERRQA